MTLIYHVLARKRGATANVQSPNYIKIPSDIRVALQRNGWTEGLDPTSKGRELTKNMTH